MSKIPNNKHTLLPEKINHPQHYNGDTPHEVIKCLHAWGFENDAIMWNSLKYLARSKKKGKELEDLKKGLWYLERKIQNLESLQKMFEGFRD